jgi:hypothetical protein
MNNVDLSVDKGWVLNEVTSSSCELQAHCCSLHHASSGRHSGTSAQHYDDPRRREAPSYSEHEGEERAKNITRVVQSSPFVPPHNGRDSREHLQPPRIASKFFRAKPFFPYKVQVKIVIAYFSIEGIY